MNADWQDLKHRQTGYLLGARPEGMEALKANVAMQKSVGIKTDIISAEDMTALEPCLGIDGKEEGDDIDAFSYRRFTEGLALTGRYRNRIVD